MLGRHPTTKILALALPALLFAAGCGSDDDGEAAAKPAESTKVATFASEPDLHPSGVRINERKAGRAPGWVFVAPKKVFGAKRSARIQAGPMILDDQGRMRWFDPMRKGQTATDFRVQSYKGRPVLTYWQGRAIQGQGDGRCIVLDERYRRIAAVGKDVDLHECQLTPRGTMLVMSYEDVTTDLRAVGGKRRDKSVDAIVEEIDVATGKVLLKWSSLDHVGMKESYEPIKKRYLGTWDYFHINSVAEDTDGNLLISARHTWAVYKIDRKTGKVIWRLGGKKSDFPVTDDKMKFAWQHDARAAGENTVRIFDNDAGSEKVRDHSQVVTIRLDPRAKKAKLVQVLQHPKGISSGTQGNSQALPNGNTFVGWGSQGHFSEFDRDGKMIFDGEVTQHSDSYRAYRDPWVGRPSTTPRASARGGVVRASWNGSTEVVRWRVLAGSTRSALKPVADGAWAGLETGIRTPSRAPYVAVQALDRGGKVLATSRTVKRR